MLLGSSFKTYCRCGILGFVFIVLLSFSNTHAWTLCNNVMFPSSNLPDSSSSLVVLVGFESSAIECFPNS